jgi:hypothetical protein
MRKVLLSFAIFISLQAFAQQDPKAVASFISIVKTHDKQALADKVVYPLRRQYPLPAVNNKQEFIARYNEIIDDTLVHIIIHSDPAKDWSEAGWRGTMLNRGQVWLDDSGRVTGINYQTQKEAAKRAALIAADKAALNPAIRDFKEPVMVFQTDKYRIRIDDMGNDEFRYTSWTLNEKVSDVPELTIPDGKFIWDGSGGNHHFLFENKSYTYKVEVTRIGKEKQPPTLTITQGNKTILSQRAKK